MIKKEYYKQYLQDITLVKNFDQKLNKLQFYDNYQEMKLQIKTQSQPK